MMPHHHPDLVAISMGLGGWVLNFSSKIQPCVVQATGLSPNVMIAIVHCSQTCVHATYWQYHEHGHPPGK